MRTKLEDVASDNDEPESKSSAANPAQDKSEAEANTKFKAEDFVPADWTGFESMEGKVCTGDPECGGAICCSHIAV